MGAYSTVISKLKILLAGGQVGTKFATNGVIHCRGIVKIGNNVKINSSHYFNPIGGMTFTSFYTKNNAVIYIGDNTGMSNCALVAHKEIRIGCNVKIGGDTRMYDTDFHSIDYRCRRNRENDLANTGAIIIEDDVFIGASCIILKNVHIGRGAIVGAGSVVTKSIPPFEIWAGNPAKKIRSINEQV